MIVESHKQIGSAMSVARGDTSQAALAAAMRGRGWRWSQSTVWAIEKGQRALLAAEVPDVASVLGIDARTLLPPAPEMPLESDVNAAFARSLRLRRAVVGWSQKQLADEIAAVSGVMLDAAAICRIERGSRRVFLDQAVAICDALTGAGLDEMLGSADPTLQSSGRSA